MISVCSRAAAVTAVIAGGVLAGSPAAWAADPVDDPGSAASVVEVESAEASGYVVVNGRRFGPAEGLEIERGEITLGSDMSALADPDGHVKDWGASFVDSEEKLQIEYHGYSYAAANIHKGKRYIRVCFKYLRDGKNMSGNQCSAAGGSTKWVPGELVHKTVWDSLKPKAPPTKFRYWTNKIDPKFLP